MATAALLPEPQISPAEAARIGAIQLDSGRYEVQPEQLDLEIGISDDAVLPDDNTVTLLATENGAQFLVSGFGLYIGKKSERIVVKKNGKVCAQVPFMRAQEVIIASRGVSFSSDLLEELVRARHPGRDA